MSFPIDGAMDLRSASVWRGAALRAGSSIVGKAAMLAATVLLTRFFARGEAGVVFLAISLAALVAAVVGLGLPEAIARSAASFDAEGRPSEAAGALRAAALVALAAGATTAAIGLAVGAALEPPNPLLGLAVAVMGASLVFQALSAGFLRAWARPLAAEVAPAAVPVAFLAGIAVLAAAGAAGVTAVWLRVGLDATAAIALLGAALAAGGPARASSILRLIQLAAPLWVASLAWVVLQHADVLILGMARGKASVGLYVPILRTGDLCIAVLGLFGAYVLPAGARLHALGKPEDVGSLYATTTKLAYAMSTPILGALMLAPDRTVALLFGFSHPSVAPAARVLALAYGLNAVLGLNGVLLAAIARPIDVARRAGAVLVLAVAADLVLITRLGILGAALGTFVAYAALNVANSTLLATRFRIPPIRMDVLATVAVSVGVAAGLWAIGLPERGTAGLVAVLVVLAGITSAVAWRTTDRDTRIAIRRSLFGGLG